MVLVLLRTVFYGNEVAVTGLHILLSYFDAVMPKHSKRKSSHHHHHSDDEHHHLHPEDHKRRHSDETRPRKSGERHRHRKHSEDVGNSRRQSYISLESASTAHRGVTADANIRYGQSQNPQSNRQSMAAHFSEMRRSLDQTAAYNPRSTSPTIPQISVNSKGPMQQEIGTAHFQRSVEQNSPQHSYSVNPISQYPGTNVYPNWSYRSSYSYLPSSTRYPSTSVTPPAVDDYQYATSTSISEQLDGNTSGKMVQFEETLESNLEASHPKPVSKIFTVAKCYFILDMILSISVIIFFIYEILRDRPISRALTEGLCKKNKELKMDFIFKTELAAKVLDVVGSILCIISILKRQRNACIAYWFTTIFSIVCSLLSIANFQCSLLVEIIAGIVLVIYYMIGLCLSVGILKALRRAKIAESLASVNVDKSYNQEQPMEYTPKTTMNAAPSVAYNTSKVHTQDWNQPSYDPESYFI